MKKIFESLWLLIIGLILIGGIYGSLNITKSAKANEDFGKEQQVLTRKIGDLEQKLSDQKTTIDNLKSDLENYQSQLAAVKKLAAAPKQIAGEIINLAPAPAPAPEPIIKTVTETVVVKEKPQEIASVIVQGLGSYPVEVSADDTAFSILQKAASQNGFELKYQSFDFGIFVTAIGGIESAGNQYWAFYYNGNYSNVGASAQTVSAGDTTFWQLASF